MKNQGYLQVQNHHPIQKTIIKSKKNKTPSLDKNKNVLFELWRQKNIWRHQGAPVRADVQLKFVRFKQTNR